MRGRRPSPRVSLALALALAAIALGGAVAEPARAQEPPAPADEPRPAAEPTDAPAPTDPAAPAPATDDDEEGGFDLGALDGEGAPADPDDHEDGDGLPDGFDLEEVDVEEEPWWLIRGRGSLIAAFYPKKDERTVDGVTGNTFSLSSIGLYVSLRIFDGVYVNGEVEYVGEDGGKIELDYAVVEWRAVEKLLTISAGLNYVPFGIERFYYAPNRNPLVDRPSPFRRVFPGTYSDIGIFVSGRVDGESGAGVRYELSVVNGLRGPDRDDRPSLENNIVRDNNSSKALAGRLGFILTPGLELGTSGYVGRHDDDDRYLLYLFGIDLRLELAGFRILAEYLRGEVEASRADGSDFSRQGYYVTVSYRWEPDLTLIHYLEPVFRVDWVDGDSRAHDFLDVDRVSVGLGWSPIEHFFVKLEVQWSTERYDEIEHNDLFFVEVGAWF